MERDNANPSCIVEIMGNSKNRDWRIDFYRVACMFGICMLHALEQAGFADEHRGLNDLMTPSVVGFMFISGYFGIRLRAIRIIELLGTALYCFAVAGLVRWFFGSDGSIVIVEQMYDCACHAWFLWLYIAVMLMAPLLEPLFDGRRNTADLLRMVAPFLFLVFGWSYFSFALTRVRLYLPIAGGFGAFTVLTFIGIYVAARTCRSVALQDKLSGKALLLLAAGGV